MNRILIALALVMAAAFVAIGTAHAEYSYGVYMATAPILSNAQYYPLRLDQNGNLMINISTGLASFNSLNQYNVTPPSLSNGQSIVTQVDSSGDIKVYNAAKNAGEDIPNDIQKIIQAPLLAATYSYLTDVSTGSLVTHNSKSGAGLVYAVEATNQNAAQRYLWLFNTTGTTTGIAPIVAPILIAPVASGVPGDTIRGGDLFGANGLYCSTGITWGVSTSSTTYTGATASDHLITVRYY